MMRTRKIASAWRTIGRLNRQNRRLSARLNQPVAPAATAKDMACIRDHASNVHGQRFVDWHIVSNGARDFDARRRAEARVAAFPDSTHYQTFTQYGGDEVQS